MFEIHEASLVSTSRRASTSLSLGDLVGGAAPPKRRTGVKVAVAVACGLLSVTIALGAFVLSSPPFAPMPVARSAPAGLLEAAAPTHCGATAVGVASGTTVIFDRRGAEAALLFVDRPNALVCLLTIDGAGTITSASSGATRLGTPVGPIVPASGMAIPEAKDFDGVTAVIGQVALAVAMVHVTVVAPWVSSSVKDGFFLAWWPSSWAATDIAALDADGRILGHAAALTIP